MLARDAAPFNAGAVFTKSALAASSVVTCPGERTSKVTPGAAGVGETLGEKVAKWRGKNYRTKFGSHGNLYDEDLKKMARAANSGGSAQL